LSVILTSLASGLMAKVWCCASAAGVSMRVRAKIAKDFIRSLMVFDERKVCFVSTLAFSVLASG